MNDGPLITNDAVNLGILMAILAFVFVTSHSERAFWKRFYSVVPSLLVCYFLPSVFTTLGVYDPDQSNLYFVASRYLLPASLVLLTLSIDLKGIMRLGPKAGVMFLAGDADGNVTLINQKGCEVLGYEQEEIIGKNWYDCFLPENIRDKVKAVGAQVMAGNIEPVEYYENAVLTSSGEERTIAWHNATLTDEDGKNIGFLSSGEDITERKRAEDALKQNEYYLSRAQEIGATKKMNRIIPAMASDL